MIFDFLYSWSNSMDTYDTANKNNSTIIKSKKWYCYNNTIWSLPGGAVVKNLPCNAKDMGLIPGRERSHMPQSN